MRNYLLDAKAWSEDEPGLFSISEKFEQLFEEQVRKRRPKMSLEQLMEIHKRQERQGRLAEEFVIQFEQRRLLWSDNASRVKQISDFDVTAGYDILSYNSIESTHYDRFIEVKSFSSSQAFYWSSNEMKVSRELKGKYFLYLVDMEQYQSSGYEPLILPNPSSVVFDSDEWEVETASVKFKARQKTAQRGKKEEKDDGCYWY